MSKTLIRRSTVKSRKRGALSRRMAANVAQSITAMNPGWRALSAYYTDLAIRRSGMAHVQVFVAPEAGNGNYGYRDRITDRIFLEGNILPASPDTLDPSDAGQFRRLAALHGVWTHEYRHVVHTQWWKADREDPQPIREAVELLEEVRMEAQAVRARPVDARWLRACAKELIFSEDMQAPEQPGWAVAHFSVLCEGRVHAGSLLAEDIAHVKPLIDDLMTDEQRQGMDEILTATVQLADDDIDGLFEQGSRLRELFPAECSICGAGASAPSQGDGKEPEQGSGEGGQGESGDEGERGEGSGGAGGEQSDGDGGQGQGGCQCEQQAAALAQAIAQAMQEAGEQASAELQDSPEGQQAQQAANTTRSDAGLEQRIMEILGGQSAGQATGNSVDPRNRPAEDEERTARRQLAAMFRKARWRDREVVKRTSLIPPGRLQMHRVMAAQAERVQGHLPTERPWDYKKRKTVIMPRLRLATLVDISASMSSQMEGVATALWVLANANHDARGTNGAWTIGDACEQVIWPTQPPKLVPYIPARGGTTLFVEALAAADEQLGLTTDTQGPRLMVVVSDGWWGGESTEANEVMAYMRAQGVVIMQVGVGMTPQAHESDVVVEIRKDAVAQDLVRVVGKQAIRLLQRA